MPLKTDNKETEIELKDNLNDTSIEDARWLLGGVAMLGILVMSLGFLATTLAV